LVVAAVKPGYSLVIDPVKPGFSLAELSLEPGHSLVIDGPKPGCNLAASPCLRVSTVTITRFASALHRSGLRSVRDRRSSWRRARYNDEFKQLAANLLRDGCKEPLTVWDGILIDGHNRYK